MNVTWKRLSETRTKIGYRTVITKRFELPDGSVHDYDVMDYGEGAASVFCLTKDSKVVIVRQFRAGNEIMMEELPGGFVDPGEDPATTAARELREETGYAGKLEPLGVIAKDAYLQGKWYGFLARNCEKVAKPEHDEREFIEIAEITIGKLLENIKTGRMTDSETALLALRKLGLCSQQTTAASRGMPGYEINYQDLACKFHK